MIRNITIFNWRQTRGKENFFQLYLIAASADLKRTKRRGNFSSRYYIFYIASDLLRKDNNCKEAGKLVEE